MSLSDLLNKDIDTAELIDEVSAIDEASQLLGSQNRDANFVDHAADHFSEHVSGVDARHQTLDQNEM